MRGLFPQQEASAKKNDKNCASHELLHLCPKKAGTHGQLIVKNASLRLICVTSIA